jgi:hypothetical protein
MTGVVISMTYPIPSAILIRFRRLIMKDYSYNLWTLTELRKDDPRAYLDIIIFNARFGKIQAIQYQENKVFVISEEQYNKIAKHLIV